MGVKDKLKKYNETHNPNEFQPIDLNGGNIQAIFNDCLKNENTKDIEYSTLFRKDFGYEKTEIPVHFDKDLIKQNAKSIEYLFGQLDARHKGEIAINPDTGRIKYDGTQWTQNNGILMEFFHLGLSANLMTPFSAQKQHAGFVNIKPTLSPKDPNFEAWWAEHKLEWENGVPAKPAGQEPADD